MALKSLMPGEHDWMQQAGVPFIPPAAQTPQAPPSNPYWMGNASQAARKIFGNQDLAMALLANSGYSPVKRSLGEIVGTSMLQAQGMQQQRAQQAADLQFREAQIRNLDESNSQAPNSVREYEFAKAQGFTGSFQDWIVAGGHSSRPSAVQEWEHYAKLMEDDKKNGTNNAQLYLEMKRNPNFVVKDVNQVPTSIHQSVAGGVSATPLSTLPATAAAAGTVKQAEAAGGELGKAQGGIAGGIQKKGSDAQNVLGMLNEADKLIDESTGSLVGTGVDTVARSVGKSTAGDKAGARLKVIQAALMTSMPRMEGPQSDRDVDLYRQAAASLGDTTIPRETRKAALQTVRDLQIKYAERAKQPLTIFPNGTTDSDGWTTLPGGIRVREKK